MMRRSLSLSFILASFVVEGTLRAATKPHAGPTPEANRTLTNEDLQRLNKVPGLISAVGQPSTEASQSVGAPASHSITEDPNWYAARAALLNAQLEAEQADVRKFTNALDDARELKSTTGGVNLAEDNIGITPEATIDILESRVRETQSELDALEDLARQNNIPPGILRSVARMPGDDVEGPQ